MRLAQLQANRQPDRSLTHNERQMKETFRANGVDYQKVDYGVFRVALSALGDSCLEDLPAHSALEVTGLPSLPQGLVAFAAATNGGEEGEFADLQISAQVHVLAGPGMDARIARVQQAFMPPIQSGALPYPIVFPPMSLNLSEGGDHWFEIYSLNFADRPDTRISEAFSPFVEGLKSLSFPEAKLFICHAGEDKATARRLAQFLRSYGLGVWFDEIEVQIGDSIVQKINEGLAGATHLALLLSPSSVAKPWVQREMSAALMRQLADRSIRLIPVRLAPCAIPPVLADIKYADCHVDEMRGFESILQAVREWWTVSTEPSAAHGPDMAGTSPGQ